MGDPVLRRGRAPRLRCGLSTPLRTFSPLPPCDFPARIEGQVETHGQDSRDTQRQPWLQSRVPIRRSGEFDERHNAPAGQPFSTQDQFHATSRQNTRSELEHPEITIHAPIRQQDDSRGLFQPVTPPGPGQTRRSTRRAIRPVLQRHSTRPFQGFASIWPAAQISQLQILLKSVGREGTGDAGTEYPSTRSDGLVEVPRRSLNTQANARARNARCCRKWSWPTLGLVVFQVMAPQPVVPEVVTRRT